MKPRVPDMAAELMSSVGVCVRPHGATKCCNWREQEFPSSTSEELLTAAGFWRMKSRVCFF